MSFPTANLLVPAQARERILQTVALLGVERVAHAEVLGRTLAADVRSPLDLPPFDNSAMDGYAVVADDLRAAGSNAPVELQLRGTLGAGDESTAPVASGTCMKIMTGATLPAGADAVVMREETRPGTHGDGGESVAFSLPANRGQHIRRAGSDVARGEVVLRAGTLVGAAQWAMLAALGCAEVEVWRRVRVGILSTGKELVDVDAVLRPGQIRDSNSFALRALAAETGADVVTVRRVDDEIESVRAALNEMAGECDAIVTSGGVSMGDFDPVRDVLQAHAQVHFWKVAMKPGKPLLFASWGTIPVFGLPGNPASALVVFEEFVRPALLRMGGRNALWRPCVRARLLEPLRRSGNRTEFVRAFVWWQDEGFLARVTGDQGSGRLSTMTRANALLVIEAETSALEAGDFVTAHLTDAPEIEAPEATYSELGKEPDGSH